MNDFRKIAKFVRDNELTVKEFNTKGTSGGFDDLKGLDFYKGVHKLCSLTTVTFSKEKTDPQSLLRNLKQALDDFHTIGVFDEDTLIEYLKKNHKQVVSE